MEYLQAVSSFKKYLAVEKGYSPLTVKEYDMDLNLLYNFLIDKMNFKKGFTIKDISKFEIAEFLADIILVDESSPATRNRKLYSIRSFFNYLTKNEYIKNNPTLTIEASKTRIRAEPIYLKLDDARRYIDIIKKYGSINQKRDLAIVKLFLYAGLRVSELVNLNLDNIDFHNQSIKFFGKGNKERSIPLHQDIIQAISEYFTERREIKKKKPDDRSALFLSRYGRRISVRAVQQMIKKYARLAGIKNAQKITPHKLRHTFASMIYQKTKDIRIIQDLLGHANISTTQIYTHTDIQQKKEAIEELPEL
jgi:integrase/recombinase XerD